MARPCPFCPPRIADKDHDRLWRALHDDSAEAAVELARDELGVDCDLAALRRHFDAHRPRQAPPRRRRPGEQPPALRGRKLAVVDLARRYRGFSAKLIRYALYWPASGNPEQLDAAEQNAAVALRELFSQDLLYRLYPERLDGPRMRRDHPPSFFLGGHGPAALEAAGLLFEGARADVLRDEHQAPARDRVMRWHRMSDVLALLYSKLPASAGVGRRHRIAPTSEVIELDLANVYDERWARISFTDPLKIASRVRAGAIIAFRYRGADGRQALVPAFLYHDRGIGPIEKIADEIPAQAALLRSGELRRAFPSLRRHSAPVTLVFTETPDRTQKLVEATQRASQVPISAFAALSSTLNAEPLEAHRFHALADPARRRLTLFEILAEQSAAFDDATRLRASR